MTMVKMIRDDTGRFSKRPFYHSSDLDKECERLIRDLLLKRHGKVEQPRVLKALSSVSTSFSQSSAWARQTVRSPMPSKRGFWPLAPPTACQRPSRKKMRSEERRVGKECA